MKTIICAAGQGTRLLPYTERLPKSLISLDGETIIEYILDSISACGLTDVIITVGHEQEAVIKKIGLTYKGCDITYVYNKDYKITDNLYSMWLCKELIDGDVIFINGDTIFHKEILEKMLKGVDPDCFAMSTPIIIEDDAMLVHVDANDNLLEIGKQISKTADGEAIGLYKLSSRTRQRYFEIADGFFGNGPRKVGFVVPLQEMSSIASIRAVRVSNSSWVQIDNVVDLERARGEIKTILGDCII